MSISKANKDSSSRDKHGRYDLITPYGLRRVALRYHFGAKKYGDRNWEKGVPLSDCLDSLLRHVNQYKMGDKEEDHIAAAAWWALAIMHFEDTGYFTEQEYDKYCPICHQEIKPGDVLEGNPEETGWYIHLKCFEEIIKRKD